MTSPLKRQLRNSILPSLVAVGALAGFAHAKTPVAPYLDVETPTVEQQKFPENLIPKPQDKAKKAKKAKDKRRPFVHLPPPNANGQISFADLVEEVSPAVVSISTERKVERQVERFPFGRPQRMPQQWRGEEALLPHASGSGFLIDGKGHIVTNYHVIQDADQIKVTFEGKPEQNATLIGVDEATDLAVLKVDNVKLPKPVAFAPRDDLRVGDWVIAVGNPFGFGGTVTSGIVSAKDRPSRLTRYDDFIQIDAPINQGNSGGPSFNLRGEVIGVNTAIFSPNHTSIGIGFAIPADTAHDVVRQLIKNGEVTRGWLGVQIRTLDTSLAEALDIPDEGAFIVGVTEGTPAEQAGFQSKDVVVKFGNKSVATAAELTRFVAQTAPGDTIDVNILREARPMKLSVKLGKREEDGGNVVLASAPEDELLDLNVRFTNLSDQLREDFDISDDVDGVLIEAVKPGSKAARAGLVPGMVVLKAQGKMVSNKKELHGLIKQMRQDGEKAILLRVQFRNNRDYRALSL